MQTKPTSDVIMIVDDEPDNLNVLGEMLRRDGLDVRAFSHGQLALEAAQEEPPDLLLLDIQMPDIDGYEVCRRFKSNEKLQAIPVIFLSAFSEPSDKVRAFEAGGIDYVTKPFAEVEVLARTHSHLRLRRYQLQLEELVRRRVQELAEANHRLSLWDAAKNQWLNTLSHEMRTPLVGIFGITELLFMELPPASNLQELREAYEVSCRRINKLIDDALTLAQMDVAAEHFGMSPLCLGEILREALAAFEGQLPECHVRASLEAAEQVLVLGEAKLLTRAFMDLLLTASCCVPAGEGLTLEVAVSAGEVYVVVSFGKTTLSLDAIETFFEVGGQRTLLKAGGDFGLGAALASRILGLFNGHVSISNKTDKGLVLISSLPIL